MTKFLRRARAALAASRKPLGTRSNMFSVVRTTTGITIHRQRQTAGDGRKARASATHHQLIDEQAGGRIEGPDSRISLTKRTILASAP